MPYSVCMTDTPIAESTLRNSLTQYLNRKGHGAISRLAALAGVSRETVRRFRDGQTPDYSTMTALYEALAQEGWGDSADIPVETRPNVHAQTVDQAETPTSWAPVTDQLAAIETQVSALSRYLSAQGVDDTAKAERLAAELAFLAKALKRLRENVPG